MWVGGLVAVGGVCGLVVVVSVNCGGWEGRPWRGIEGCGRQRDRFGDWGWEGGREG